MVFKMGLFICSSPKPLPYVYKDWLFFDKPELIMYLESGCSFPLPVGTHTLVFI